jgi:hypothetical protein
MKRTDVTYGQLEKALRAFGFTYHQGIRKPPGRIYVHEQTGATVALPASSESEKVYLHHMVAAELELENFGIADASTFKAQLQNAG